MRKLMLAGVIAVLGAGLLATSASAFNHHFGVLLKEKSVKKVGDRKYVFKEKLLDPHNRHNRVGHFRATCRINQNRNARCHGVFHLNGKIGGFGDIRVRGDYQPARGDKRLNVVGGSGQFDGVAGKAIVHNTRSPRFEKAHFDLTR